MDAEARVAVITGAGCGIGAGVAQACAAVAMMVGEVDISEVRARAVAPAIRERGRLAVKLPDSVETTTSRPTTWDRLVEPTRYVRFYPTEPQVLGVLLPQVETPAQIIGGQSDWAVTPRPQGIAPRPRHCMSAHLSAHH
jgi:hypothetical protein